jgi:hypothetical protein
MGDHPCSRVGCRRHLPRRRVAVTDADDDPRRCQSRDRRQASLHLRGQRHRPQRPRPRRQQVRDRGLCRRHHPLPAVRPGPGRRQEGSLHVHAEHTRTRRRIRHQDRCTTQGVAHLGYRGGDEGGQERGDARLRQAPRDERPPGRLSVGQVHAEITVDLEIDQAGHEVPGAEHEIRPPWRRPPADLGHATVGDQHVARLEDRRLARPWDDPGRRDQQLTGQAVPAFPEITGPAVPAFPEIAGPAAPAFREITGRAAPSSRAGSGRPPPLPPGPAHRDGAAHRA